jgi:hypothetical protein
MEWLFGAALLPFLLCGIMCAGAVLFAAVGLRRNGPDSRDCCAPSDAGDQHDEEHREIDA